KLQIRGGKRPPEHGERSRSSAIIRSADPSQSKFRSPGNRARDADQAFAQQQGVGSLPRCHRGNIIGRAGGSVVGSKDWIGATGVIEASLDAGGSERPAFTRLVATHAFAPVAAQALKERVVEVHRPLGREGLELAAGVAGRR